MLTYISQAGVFLIEVFFQLYSIAILLYCLSWYLRIALPHPLMLLLTKITSPFISPAQKHIRLNTGVSLITLLLIVVAIKICLITLISSSQLPRPVGLGVLAIADILTTIMYLYQFIIIVRVIINWVVPHTYNPIFRFLFGISAPILAVAQRLVPPLGGIDWSPLLVIILIQLTFILMINPLVNIGAYLA